MILKPRRTYIGDAKLAPGTTALLGSTVKIPLDRTWPIEEIVISCDLTQTSTIMSNGTVDGALKFLKRVNLSINDGVQPRSVVDLSGPGIIEYASNVGLNLDTATLGTLAVYKTLASSGIYRINYRIPLVHPALVGDLRVRSLLDVNNHPQDPILTLDFGTYADMAATASLASCSAHIVVVKREVPPALNAALLAEKAAGRVGYIPSDLIESTFALGTGVTGEQRFQVPTPGQYLNLLGRMYKGGASVTRGDFSENTTVQSESRWRLETGGIVLNDWRMRDQFEFAMFSRPLNSPTVASSPNGGPALASNTNYQDPFNFYLDFLTDGVTDAGELGSLLDCNIPANSGLKMEIIGPVASAATNGHQLMLIGQRFFGDLSKWQALKV